MPPRTRILARLFVVVLAALVLASCSAHPARRAGTGDVAFRLVWDGLSDLDLFVQDPAGSCIFWGNRGSTSGGQLDVDCNAASDRLCAAPIENVFWPASTAPPGAYTYWVQAQSLVPGEEALRFEVQVLRRTEVVWRATVLLGEQPIFGPFVYRFPDSAESPVAAAGPLPDCPFNLPGAPGFSEAANLNPAFAGRPVPPPAPQPEAAVVPPPLR